MAGLCLLINNLRTFRLRPACWHTMERGCVYTEVTMTNIQVRDIQNKKKLAEREQKLVYRGVAYLKKSTQQAV